MGRRTRNKRSEAFRLEPISVRGWQGWQTAKDLDTYRGDMPEECRECVTLACMLEEGVYPDKCKAREGK